MPATAASQVCAEETQQTRVPGPEREYACAHVQVAATPFISDSINYWIKSVAPKISLAEAPLQASWDRYATLLPKAVLEQVPPHPPSVIVCCETAPLMMMMVDTLVVRDSRLGFDTVDPVCRLEHALLHRGGVRAGR